MAANGQEAADGYTLLTKAGSDPPESLKSLWGRMDGPHLSTAKNMLKVQATKCRCSGCQYLIDTLEEVILNWTSLNFLSFIFLENKTKPVQCLGKFLPGTSIYVMPASSLGSSAYSPSIRNLRRKIVFLCCFIFQNESRTKNNQRSPLACWSYVTFIGR